MFLILLHLMSYEPNENSLKNALFMIVMRFIVVIVFDFGLETNAKLCSNSKMFLEKSEKSIILLHFRNNILPNKTNMNVMLYLLK